MGTNVNRGEWTTGGAMMPNFATQPPTDGFRIWNPGYAATGGAYNPNDAIDIWTGTNGTTHMRYDNSGLLQGINLQFEQYARLNGFWLNAAPLANQTAFRGHFYFNLDSIEVSRFSNVNNAGRGFMRIGLQPAGLLGWAAGAVEAARRLEVYDNAAVPQFRITQTDGTNYTDFQTTSNGDLFIDPWAGTTSRNVGIGLSTPTAKLEVNSPTIAGGSQTTVKVDNINTGAVIPVGIEIDIQGTSGAGLSQAVGMDIAMNAPVSTNSSACSITNSCNGGAGGTGVWANIDGANTNNYGFRSSVSNGTSGNYGAYLIGDGGPLAIGADIYASNGTADNFAIKSAASGASGSTDARGITTSAQGSTTNYGGYFWGLAASSNTAYGTFSIANNGNAAYGLHAAASGATTNNYGINALSSGGVNSIGIYASASGGTNNWAVYANGNTWSTTTWSSSDATLKSNILPMQNNTAIVMQLQPKSYDFNQTAHPELVLPDGIHYGLVAQELEQVVPSLVKDVSFPAQYDSAGAITSAAFSFKSVNYIEVIPFLIGTIQELKQELDSLKTFVYGSSLSPKINSNQELSQKIILSNQQGIILNQNDPNPFSESTRIRYYIPEEVQEARLIFSSENGIVIKTVQLSERGEGSIEVYASDLSSGLYIYTLMANGKIIESKKMIKQ